MAKPKPDHECAKCRRPWEVNVCGEKLCDRHWQQRCDLIGDATAKRALAASQEQRALAFLREEGVTGA